MATSVCLLLMENGNGKLLFVFYKQQMEAWLANNKW
jgi:hypothetical protein